MTTKGLQVDQVADAFVAVPGVSVEMMRVIPSAIRSSASTSFVDVHAEIASSFIAPVAGKYLIGLKTDVYPSAGFVSARYRLVFDVGTGDEQNVGYDDQSWDLLEGFTNQRATGLLQATVDLAAGSHTLKVQWKQVLGGGGTMAVDTNSVFHVIGTLVSGSGAGGHLIDYQTKSADQTGLTTGSWQQITGLQHTFIASENEEVILTWGIWVYRASGGNHALGYSFDGGTTIYPLSINSVSSSFWYFDTGSKKIQVSAGSHTLNFYIYPTVANLDIKGGSSQGSSPAVIFDSYSELRQYRGGLVPIQQSGTGILDTPRALNFIGATVEDNGGVADINLGWETVLDLDFSAEGNQTLSPNGPYTIGGLTWTKINSANDAVAMAIVNGSGLVIQPVAATDHGGATRTLPAITIPLSSIISDIDAGMRFRVSIYISAGNWTANYDFTELTLENGLLTNTHFSIRHQYLNAQVLGAVHFYNGADQTGRYNANLAANNVLQLDVINGLGAVQVLFGIGQWSAGWPAQADIIPWVYRLATGATMSELYSGATPIINKGSAWNILLGAARAGSGTSFSTTIARIKVEVHR